MWNRPCGVATLILYFRSADALAELHLNLSFRILAFPQSDFPDWGTPTKQNRSPHIVILMCMMLQLHVGRCHVYDVMATSSPQCYRVSKKESSGVSPCLQKARWNLSVYLTDDMWRKWHVFHVWQCCYNNCGNAKEWAFSWQSELMKDMWCWRE